MKLISTLALAAFAFSIGPACDDTKAETKAQTSPTPKDPKQEVADVKAAEAKVIEEKKATPAVDPVPSKVDDATPPTGAPGKVGVAECDEYIATYSKCIDEKLPEATRGLMRGAMEQSAKAWKEAAAGPSKAEVPGLCKAAIGAAKQATSSYGCVW